MSLRRHVCRVSFPAKPCNDYVWISEDVLNGAVERFTHSRCSRRHVGHVPGPLEARKRATKRRMMNLAPVGWGTWGTGIDPSLLSGFRQPWQPSWQWQSLTAPKLDVEYGTTREIAGICNGLQALIIGQTSLPCKAGLAKVIIRKVRVSFRNRGQPTNAWSTLLLGHMP